LEQKLICLDDLFRQLTHCGLGDPLPKLIEVGKITDLSGRVSSPEVPSEQKQRESSRAVGCLFPSRMREKIIDE